jgi:hypothetical protein
MKALAALAEVSLVKHDPFGDGMRGNPRDRARTNVLLLARTSAIKNPHALMALVCSQHYCSRAIATLTSQFHYNRARWSIAGHC